MMILTAEEIVRELKRYRFDRRGLELGGKRIPLKVFGDHVGVRRQTLNNIINGVHGVSEPMRIRLSQGIQDVRSGRIRFRRHGQHWHVEGRAVEAI